MGGRVARCLVVTLLLTLAVVGTGPAAAQAAEPDPVLNKVVFNDPLGTRAEQHALVAQLGRLIDRVPAGETIRMSFADWTHRDGPDSPDEPDLVDRLINAFRRGVHIQIIVDHRAVGQEPYLRLSPVLRHDDKADSYLVECGEGRGCLGTRVIGQKASGAYAVNRNKFLLASKIVLNNGSTLSGVVYQGSANLGRSDAVQAYHDGVTWSEPVSYQAYLTYFRELRDARRTPGTDDHHSVSPSGTDYKAHIFPRPERAGRPLDDPDTDSVMSLLDGLKGCTYTEGGVLRQTDVRLAARTITRVEVARRLAALVKAGCWVDVIYSDVTAAVRTALGRDIQLTRCAMDKGPDPELPDGNLDIRLGSTYLLFDGAYEDDTDPRVFTGSHELTIQALRQDDNVLVRIMGRTMHDDYLRQFWRVRHTCAAHGGVVQ